VQCWWPRRSSSWRAQAAADCNVDPKAYGDLPGDEDNCLQCELRERLQWRGQWGKIFPCIREEAICEVTELQIRELAEDGSPAPSA
jgi:hypothetical protein